ncbi:MAG TPA: hypothetical protein VNQ79_17885 [Blastocatellia bacterium]|nr:hypothetical protein [Blastocatellia bacterium]
MPLITLEICRVPVVITASAQLISVIADYFRYYHPQPISSPFAAPQSALSLSLEACTSPLSAASADAEMLSQWEVMQLWRRPQTGAEPEGFELRTPDALIIIEPEAGRATGQLAPQAVEVAHTLAYIAVLLLLRTRGIYHLHAAAALSPENELFVICGEPKAGKTTLATALGLAGWNPIADDALLIYEAESGAELSAFRRSFHLSNDILERWPKLNEMLRHQRTPLRTWASGLEFFDTVRLAETACNRIDCILLPQLSNAERTRTEPVSLSEALLRLAQQSMFFQLWPEQTKQQMKLLTVLAGKAVCLRFLAGRDILADPQCAAQPLRSR